MIGYATSIYKAEKTNSISNGNLASCYGKAANGNRRMFDYGSIYIEDYNTKLKCNQ